MYGFTARYDQLSRAGVGPKPLLQSMGKKSPAEVDEMSAETPRLSKGQRKQLTSLTVTSSGTKSNESQGLSGTSPKSVNKSPRGINHLGSKVPTKLDFSSPQSVSSKVGISPRSNGTPRTPSHTFGAERTFSDNVDLDPEYVNADITADELRQIEQVLRTLEPRLEELYKKVMFNNLISKQLELPFLHNVHIWLYLPLRDSAV